MNAASFINLYEYTDWANQLVFDRLALLDASQSASVLQQCVHFVQMQGWWLHYLEHGSLPDFNAAQPQTMDAVRQTWDAVHQNSLRYLRSVTDEGLEAKVRPPFWEEDKQPIETWQALLQVANHSTDHRAHVLAEIEARGGQGVGQDYLDFLFMRQKRDAA